MAATEDDVLAQLDVVNNTLSLLSGDINEALTLKNKLSEISQHLSDISSYTRSSLDPSTALSQLISVLKDIHADAVGSWKLDKSTGILTIYDIHGDLVAKFHMDDTESYSHKERRTDLEV